MRLSAPLFLSDGAAVLVIDLWEKSITEVVALIEEIREEEPKDQFVVTRLGSSRDFPFKGLFAVAVKVAGEPLNEGVAV